MGATRPALTAAAALQTARSGVACLAGTSVQAGAVTLTSTLNLTDAAAATELVAASVTGQASPGLACIPGLAPAAALGGGSADISATYSIAFTASGGARRLQAAAGSDPLGLALALAGGPLPVPLSPLQLAVLSTAAALVSAMQLPLDGSSSLYGAQMGPWLALLGNPASGAASTGVISMLCGGAPCYNLTTFGGTAAARLSSQLAALVSPSPAAAAESSAASGLPLVPIAAGAGAAVLLAIAAAVLLLTRRRRRKRIAASAAAAEARTDVLGHAGLNPMHEATARSGANANGGASSNPGAPSTRALTLASYNKQRAAPAVALSRLAAPSDATSLNPLFGAASAAGASSRVRVQSPPASSADANAAAPSSSTAVGVASAALASKTVFMPTSNRRVAYAGAKIGGDSDDGSEGNTGAADGELPTSPSPPAAPSALPVPAGWAVRWSETQHRFFWYREADHVTSWTLPADAPLAEGWTEKWSASQQRPFWYYEKDGSDEQKVTTWERPTEPAPAAAALEAADLQAVDVSSGNGP